MVYRKDDRNFNFNEESISSQTFREFKGNFKYLGWSEEELKQVYSLITKDKTNKAAESEAEPPSN